MLKKIYRMEGQMAAIRFYSQFCHFCTLASQGVCVCVYIHIYMCVCVGVGMCVIKVETVQKLNVILTIKVCINPFWKHTVRTTLLYIWNVCCCFFFSRQIWHFRKSAVIIISESGLSSQLDIYLVLIWLKGRECCGLSYTLYLCLVLLVLFNHTDTHMHPRTIWKPEYECGAFLLQPIRHFPVKSKSVFEIGHLMTDALQ